jgi:hypothetical protein
MHPESTGWARAGAALWLVCLGLVACHPVPTISGPGPEAPSPVWDAGDPICLVQPPDWRSGDVVYSGSGAALANRIARQLTERRAKVIRLVGERHPFALCAAQRGKYVVVPVILDWESHTTFFTKSVRVKLRLSLMRPEGEKPLRTVDFAMEHAAPNVILFPSQELPPKQFDEAVQRLLPR